MPGTIREGLLQDFAVIEPEHDYQYISGIWVHEEHGYCHVCG
jgi:hypothetical protein